MAIGGNTNQILPICLLTEHLIEVMLELQPDTSCNYKVQLWSDFGESTVTIGTSESNIGANGQIKYGNRNLGSSI